jgi:diguanylate cyclase (GGDEF)-like protein
MTIARSGAPFSAGEREVFLYLVGQAAASVENIALHELVSEQAVTDDLTGLANKRAFLDLMEGEAARAHRFGHDLSLLILDLDDFKQVNDTYGHPQGDAVLKAVGRALAAESREIDVPARYGGEEFVVALPETDSEGAVELGDRIRERIESGRVTRLDGGGEIKVTASLEVATLPGEAADVGELIAAADGALRGEAPREEQDRRGPGQRARNGLGIGQNCAARGEGTGEPAAKVGLRAPLRAAPSRGHRRRDAQ